LARFLHCLAFDRFDLISQDGVQFVVNPTENNQRATKTADYRHRNKAYYLEPTAEELDFRLLMAGDMLSPLIGNEEIDPQSDSFSQWLMNL